MIAKSISLIFLLELCKIRNGTYLLLSNNSVIVATCTGCIMTSCCSDSERNACIIELMSGAQASRITENSLDCSCPQTSSNRRIKTDRIRPSPFTGTRHLSLLDSPTSTLSSESSVPSTSGQSRQTSTLELCEMG